MRGEGERREGEDDSEDPFEKYAEELGGKYEERGEVDEENPDAKSTPATKEEVTGAPEETEDSGEATGNQDGSVEKSAEPPKETGEIKRDEFEAYAKELTEKYDGGEGGIDSTRVREGRPEIDGESASQEDWSREFNAGGERDPEPAKSVIQPREDTSEEGVPKPTEVGSYQRIADDSSERMDAKTAPLNSEQTKDTSPDKTTDPKEQEPPKAIDSRQDGPPRTPSVDDESGKKRPGEDVVLKEAVHGVEKPNDRTGDSDEKHVVTIVSDRTHKRVYISEGCLESTGLKLSEIRGDKDLVLEVYGRIVDDGTVKHFFGTYRPDAKNHFQLRLGAHDGKPGDQFEVLKTVPHDVDGFLREFEKRKPKSLENVAFNRDTRGLMMHVDGAAYQVRNPRLSAFAGIAKLSGRLAATDKLIQLQIDGERSMARIQSHQIAAIKVPNGVLDISYQHTDHVNKIHHFRLAQVAEGKAFSASVYERSGAFGVGIPKRAFKEVTGKVMKAGKEYIIEGRVEGICHFKVRHFHSEKSVRSSRVNLFLGTEARGKLKPREKYSIVIESITERRDFKITTKRNLVWLRRPSKSSLGLNETRRGKDVIVELRAKNLARSGTASERYFVASRPDAKQIRLEGVKGRKGDILRFENPRRYVTRQFVNEFKAHKPENLKNVDLDFNKDHIAMHVDGKTAILRNPRLSAQGLRAHLAANIESTGREIRFSFDGERIDARLSWFRIQSMRASDSGIELTYSKNRTESRTFLLRFNPFNESTMVGNIALVSTPRGEGGSYHFRASPGFRSYMERRLDQMNDDLGKFGLRSGKGNDSEIIQHYLISMALDWEKVAEHPFNTAPNADPGRQNGPDSVYRRAGTHTLCYVELKWDKGGRNGYTSGSRQTRLYLSKYPEYHKEKVQEGYVGILDWDVRSHDMFFSLRKVKPKEQSWDDMESLR